ncbi:MAG TPA: SPOR domain-containing protein, partial [Piscinibacter sp.]|nr:SPOR domain-containing protein [Piscinibacter sp.]
VGQPRVVLHLGEGSTVKPTPAADPFNYFVQAGAFARPEDAEQQRARLAMMGYEAKVSEREQSGRTVYRVRIGPFPAKDGADGAKDKLAAAGVESALVRVQK